MKILIYIGPYFRRGDVKLLFMGSKIIYLPIIKAVNLSKVYSATLILVLNLIKKATSHIEFDVWVSDNAIMYFSELKCRFDKVGCELKFLAWNIETDFPFDFRANSGKKFVLFSQKSECFLQDGFERVNYKIPIRSNKFNERTTNGKIIYFGELSLAGVDLVKDNKILRLVEVYSRETTISRKVIEADQIIIDLYNEREIYDGKRFNDLCLLKNYQRWFYLKQIQRVFGNKLVAIGDDLIKYGFNAQPSIHNRSQLNKMMTNSSCVLDLGSKSFCETLYPRSIFALTSSRRVVQLYQGNGSDIFVDGLIVSKGDRLIDALDKAC